jgi:hypothetical protein
MSDLEARLTEALHAETEGAPDAHGLADAARARARTRRRTTLAGVGAAAVAAVVVPVAVVALGGSDGGKEPVADDPTASDVEPADNGRWESWHGVTVQVPDEWEYGDQAAWCADGGSVETFRVTRPGGVSESIACTPASSYGLSFSEVEMDDSDEPFEWPVVAQTNNAWPAGTYVGARGTDGVVVMVAGPDRDDVIAVLDTVRPVADGVDPNGCSPDIASVHVPATGLAVCRYDSAGRLEQSELLAGTDAEEAATALTSAPGYADLLGCEEGHGPVVTMTSQDLSAVVELSGNCPAVTGPGTEGAATADVLYWALSPGWTGAVDENVPLPPELRRR